MVYYTIRYNIVKEENVFHACRVYEQKNLSLSYVYFEL